MSMVSLVAMALALHAADAVSLSVQPQAFAYDCSQETGRPPQGPGLPWDPNLVELTVQDLGSGAYVLIDSSSTAEMVAAGAPLPTTGGFIVTAEGVVVVEGWINNYIACRARSLIAETTAEPIKFVVCTSSHGDHCFGSSVFDAEGVTFVMHQHTRERLMAPLVQIEKNFLMYAFGSAAGINETTPVTADMNVQEQGDEDVEIVAGEVTVKYFGFAQTPGDLFVYHHATKTLYTGNPIISPGPSLPWLLDGHVDGAMDALAQITNFIKGSVSNTVPGHGTVSEVGNVTSAMYLDYLAKLKATVAQSLASGETLPEAILSNDHTFAEYRGYMLYGWVHEEINFPFAYVEAGGKLEDGEWCGGVCFAPQGFGNGPTECDYCESGSCGGEGGTCSQPPIPTPTPSFPWGPLGVLALLLLATGALVATGNTGDGGRRPAADDGVELAS